LVTEEQQGRVKRVSADLGVKRKYLVWLKDARGLSEASIDKAVAAIAVYEEWLGLKDFRAFHSESARAFKRHLASRRKFAALGIGRDPWASASSAAGIFKQAFAETGLPPFSPHRVRDTVVELASDHCRTPEDFKAWSQNMGHEDVLTTFRSTVPFHRDGRSS
jgi:integrase